MKKTVGKILGWLLWLIGPPFERAGPIAPQAMDPETINPQKTTFDRPLVAGPGPEVIGIQNALTPDAIAPDVAVAPRPEVVVSGAVEETTPDPTVLSRPGGWIVGWIGMAWWVSGRYPN